MTRASGEDDTGGGVAMREDNADENSAGTPELVGVRQQKEDHNEERTT